MSEIKYEDIYYMTKDVAYDQVDPIEAYKEIEKEIIKITAERDKLVRKFEELEEQYMNLDMQSLELTAERDRYKGERDALMDISTEMMQFIGRVADWHGPDPDDKKWRTTINKIKEG